MTVKLKNNKKELWKGLNLAWYHDFTHKACAKNREGYGKNWKHFVYKLDNLFWSIWGLDEKTHLLHRQFIFLTYYNSGLFMHSVCMIQGHNINFQTFLLSFAIFIHLLICF